MADIELVIKIPEEMYKWVNDVNKFFDDYGTSDFIDLVKNGTPLPKGHGRLIDADRTALLSDLFYYTKYTGIDEVPYEDATKALDFAPTIIEADKAESEG